jgi:uncharacterized protein (DUF362 family)
MRRRDFLILSGMSAGWLALNSGCSRLLDWSASLHEPAVKTIKKPVPEEIPKAKKLPDLAVAKGGEPAENLAAVLKALGGMERFVKKGAKVAIKPNMFTSREPQYAATTNPDLVGAVVKACFAAGAASVSVFDRSTSDQNQVFEISGIGAAVTAAGGEVKILTDRNFENTAIPAGKVLTEWPLVKDVFEADVFINMPIAKNHGMAILTMSMKNLMGIMGGARGTIHIDFDQKIVDVNTLVKPHLIILDAYRILVRNGPTGGDLADVETPKTLVAGTNAVSIDAYATSLFGLKPADLSYIVRANEQGLGEIDMGKLNITETKTG